MFPVFVVVFLATRVRGLSCDGGAVVTLLTTIPQPLEWAEEAHVEHLTEIMLALGENSRTQGIGEIRVLMDRAPLNATQRLRMDVTKAQKENAHMLDGVASWTELSKIQASVVGHQPTYAEIFKYASEELPGHLVALINADIVLRNLQLLDASAFKSDRDVNETLLKALVLTVRPPSGNFKRHCPDIFLTDRCSSAMGNSSYDGFVFKSPLPQTARYDFLEVARPRPVFMNENGAENRAKQFLMASGYELFNPCLANLTEHWHCSHKMHHQKKRVDGAHFANGTFLRDINPGEQTRVTVAQHTPGLCSSSSSSSK